MRGCGRSPGRGIRRPQAPRGSGIGRGGERPPHAAEGRDCPAQPRSRLPPEIASAILMMPNGLQSSRPPRFPGRRNRTATELPIALFAFSVIQCVFWLDFKRPFPCGSAAKVRRMRLRRAPECGFSGAAPPSVLATRWLAAYCHPGDGPGASLTALQGAAPRRDQLFRPRSAGPHRGGGAERRAKVRDFLPSVRPFAYICTVGRKRGLATKPSLPAGSGRFGGAAPRDFSNQTFKLLNF